MNDKILLALQFSATYISYVQEKNPELHMEADGTPSACELVAEALELMKICPNYQMNVSAAGHILGKVGGAESRRKRKLATLQQHDISGGEHDVVKDAIHEHIFGE
jgi:hypothetical protein